ncbi:TRAP transporter large permease [Eoetvoesiella caeni]|uniref:TRAP transporter large permease protein n=1 Tax=Eoetvoesiella caeni TaxID=645616 RepID=A0A366HGT7_9BURK|nr:TRAP transporter large permease [Eoetvoesiella caeni]MCI2807862.1 TRAP transporter large permease [Eoetvoesiella caeni]NYT54136.1 TRAP transporter large permease [Eoetvoesiella caeni]RBP41779.1 tripartite ATP-independent transporter DctM subunit [Eoetvoesiella caeni]
MEWQFALSALLGVLFVLMLIGVPVAFAFLGVNLLGAWFFMGGEAGLGQLVRNSIQSVNSFSLTPIPLFILMGEILFHSGLAFRAINAIERLIAKIPGRLSIVSVVGGTIFATLSGSTIANTAMMGGTLLPEMLKRGYHPSISMGPIMAVGGIAMLIPPSALAVMLGSLAGISISQLLIGGILPGLILAVLFVAYVMVRCTLNPELAPADAPGDHTHGWERWKPFVRDVVPLFAIFIAVVGSMLIGWASPTESAAIGAVASAIAVVCYGAFTTASFYKALIETARISVIILFVLIASTTFSQLLSFSGATTGLLQMIGQYNLSPIYLVIGMLLILLFLGCIIDQVSMMMITLPFFMPLANTAGIDPVWLGVMLLLAMEIGLLTPPFGLLCMVMQSVAPGNIRLTQIYGSVMPFIILEVLVLGAMLFLPWIATGLPQLMVTP